MKAFIPFLFLMTSCTVSINLTHTEGVASDLVDTSQTTEPEIDPTISLPISPL